MRMEKSRALLAVLALSCGAVMSWGADDGKQPEAEVSRTVYGGDHGTTVNFDHDVAGDGKSHKVKANVASGAPLKDTRVGGNDMEFDWEEPKQVAETKVEFDGTVKIKDAMDRGYKSNFKGNVGGEGGLPGGQYLGLQRTFMPKVPASFSA